MRRWLKKNRGSMMLEAALTLPIVFYMIFFAIELIRVNKIQVKLNAIAEECSMDYAVYKDPTRFADIITKYGMTTDQQNNILQYSLVIYNSFTTMMSADPYGGMDIIIDPTNNSSDYLVTTNDSPVKPNAVWSGSGNKSGHPFMLTFTYKYQFSSAFVAKLFNGGTNTKNKTAYLLWARGVGICE